MSAAIPCGQPKNAIGGKRRRQPLTLMLALATAAFAERADPAVAQLAPGTALPSIGPAGVGGYAPSLVPGGALAGVPSALPPPAVGPFGLPNPLSPPSTAPPAGVAVPTAPPTPGLTLPAPGAGIPTLQAYGPHVPAVLIQPYASLSETLYTNVNYTATNHTAAAETSLAPGLSISADTPRFTGIMSGSVQGSVYTPTSYLDQVTANMFGQGTGTILPDRLFVDVASSINEASTLPGLGFVSPSLLPRTQRTLTFTNTVSPYLRENYEDWLQGELRYRFASTDYLLNNGVTSTPNPLNNTLANGTLNEGTLVLTNGVNYQRLGSRLTVDALEFNSNSTAQNTQFSAFDDIQYYFRPNIAALGRVGYQNIQYPFAPAASFAGATWLAGGRLGTAVGRGYIALEYGRVQGVYGLNGTANYEITPTLTFQAYLTQGIATGGQSLVGSLATSTLGPSGAVVNSATGLPTTFFNPGTGLTNTPYRQHLYNFGLTDQIGRNSYSLFIYYINSQPLAPPITAPTNSSGASLTWGRSIRPDLNGYTSLAYSRTANVVTINAPTPVSATSTLSAYIGVNRNFARALTGSILYTFTYQPNGGIIVNGRSGDIVANSLQFVLTKAF